MDEDLLHDLSKYKSYRDKSVSASARSLIQLFREKNPQLLERKDRGKPTEFQRDLVPLNYGQTNPKSYLEGAEILQENIDDQDPQARVDEKEADEGDGEDDGDEWVQVSHSDDDDDDDDDDVDGDEQKERSEEKVSGSRWSEGKDAFSVQVAPVEMTEEERRQRAMAISGERILTQADFEQLKVIEVKRRIQDRRRNRLDELASSSNSKKRKTISINTDSDSDEEKTNEK